MSSHWQRPPFESFDLDFELACIEAADAGDAQREHLRAIARVWSEVVRARMLTPAGLATLRAGMADSWSSVHATAGRYLAHAAHYFPEAATAFVAGTRDASAGTRLNTVNAVLARPPRTIAVAVCAAALSDRSRQVRQRAVEVVVELALSEVVPGLRAAAATESDPAVQRALRRALTLFGE